MRRFNAACRQVALTHEVVLLEGFDHPVTSEPLKATPRSTEHS
jgi:hypothetical protein